MSRQIDIKTTMQVRMDKHMVRYLKREANDRFTTIRALVEQAVVQQWGDVVSRENRGD